MATVLNPVVTRGEVGLVGSQDTPIGVYLTAVRPDGSEGKSYYLLSRQQAEALAENIRAALDQAGQSSGFRHSYDPPSTPPGEEGEASPGGATLGRRASNPASGGKDAHDG